MAESAYLVAFCLVDIKRLEAAVHGHQKLYMCFFFNRLELQQKWIDV